MPNYDLKPLIRRLAGTIQQTFEQTAETKPLEACLGLGDGTDTIIDSDFPEAGAVFYYFDGSDETGAFVRGRGTAILGEGLAYLYQDGIGLEGTAITVVKKPRKSTPYVVRTDRLAEKNVYGPVPLEKQAFNSAAQPALTDVSTLSVAWSNNDDLTLIVGNPNERFAYTNYNTGALAIFTEGPIDLATVVGSITPGYHLLSAVCLDTADGTIKSIEITEVEAERPLPDRDGLGVDHIGAISVANYPSYLPIRVIYLYNGQTAGDNDDIVQDVRLWLNAAGAANANGTTANVITTDTTIPANRSYVVVDVLTVNSGVTLTVDGYLGVL